jgi:hypothetical protein
MGAVQLNQEALLNAAVAGKVTRQGLQSAMSMATTMKREPLAAVIKAALDKLPAESAAPAFTVDAASLPKYVGNYRDQASGFAASVTLQNDALMLQVQGQPAVKLVPTAENVFRVVEVNATLTFNQRGGLVESIGLVQGPANLTLVRVVADTPAAAAATAPAPWRRRSSGAIGPHNWPSFRGEGMPATAISRAVVEWTPRLENIKWKTAVPERNRVRRRGNHIS